MSLASLPPGADLTKIPLAPNPNGDPPNFNHPPTQAYILIGVGSPLVAIALLCVSLRVVASIKSARRLAIDDWLCLVAFVMVTGYFGLACALRITSRHMWDIPLSELNETFSKKSFAFNLIAGPSLSMAKLAIVALYLRLFQPERWFRAACWITAFVTFMVYWATIPTAAVQCSPKGGVWVVRVECGDSMTMLGVVTASFGTAIDVALMVLPLPVLHKLHLPTKKKYGLAFVFLTGILCDLAFPGLDEILTDINRAVVCTIVSLSYRIKIFKATDKFWNSSIVSLCAVAEGYITIMVSCAPALYSFWSNIFLKSAFYSSLRSTISKTNRSKSTISKFEGNSNGHSREEHAAQFNDNYHASLLRTKVISDVHLGDVEASIPYGIQKSTTIEQSTRNARPGSESSGSL